MQSCKLYDDKFKEFYNDYIVPLTCVSLNDFYVSESFLSTKDVTGGFKLVSEISKWIYEKATEIVCDLNLPISEAIPAFTVTVAEELIRSVVEAILSPSDLTSYKCSSSNPLQAALRLYSTEDTTVRTKITEAVHDLLLNVNDTYCFITPLLLCRELRLSLGACGLCTGGTQITTSTPSFGMSPKKCHEVTAFSAFIDSILRTELLVDESWRIVNDNGSSVQFRAPKRIFIVDIGAGQGYLSCELCRTDPYYKDDNCNLLYSVIAIEREGNNCYSAGTKFSSMPRHRTGTRPKNAVGGRLYVENMEITKDSRAAKVATMVLSKARLENEEQLKVYGAHLATNFLEVDLPPLVEVEQEIVVVLVSLHACGSLSCRMLDIFAENYTDSAMEVPQVCYVSDGRSCNLSVHYKVSFSALFNVGCCYNLITESQDFPLTRSASQTSHYPLSAAMKMAACQAPARWCTLHDEEATKTSKESRIGKRAHNGEKITNVLPWRYLKDIVVPEGEMIVEFASQLEGLHQRAILQRLLMKTGLFSPRDGVAPQRLNTTLAEPSEVSGKLNKKNINRVCIALEFATVAEAFKGHKEFPVTRNAIINAFFVDGYANTLIKDQSKCYRDYEELTLVGSPPPRVMFSVAVALRGVFGGLLEDIILADRLQFIFENCCRKCSIKPVFNNKTSSRNRVILALR